MIKFSFMITYKIKCLLRTFIILLKFLFLLMLNFWRMHANMPCGCPGHANDKLIT